MNARMGGLFPWPHVEGSLDNFPMGINQVVKKKKPNAFSSCIDPFQEAADGKETVFSINLSPNCYSGILNPGL